MKVCLIALCLALAAPRATAQEAPTTTAQATVELDWDAVEGASSYEVQLTPRGRGEPIVISTDENKLTRRVPVGTYDLRIRSKEVKTGYFGKWSAPTPIEVSAKSVLPLAPSEGTVLSAVKENAEIVFRWEPKAEAKSYVLRVWSENESDAQEFTLEGAEKELTLPAGRTYRWTVTFIDKQSVAYESDPVLSTFSLLGRRLVRPEIDPNVRLQEKNLIRWSASMGARTYDVKLLWRYLDEDEWRPLKEAKGLSGLVLATDKLKPAAYRVEVIAHAPLRTSSEPGVREFTVKPSEAEIEAVLRPLTAKRK